MIKLTDVTKIYESSGERKVALDNVSLTIADGELLAIMGPSGSGKSTLLNIIGMVNTYTEGKLVIADRAINNMKNSEIEEFRRKMIGFVYQHFALMDYYTAYENIELPLLINNTKAHLRKRKIQEAMQMLGIEEVKNKIPSKMSGGQRQRVAIARALVSDAPIILADEPTGALDQSTGQEIMNILKDINAMGKTVIIVTHDIVVAQKTNRIIKISDGKVVSDIKNFS
jgi:putative ABC transport system ATP-binding protein